MIGTKVSEHLQFKGLTAANIAAALGASLTRLGTDYINVYYAHIDDPKTPLAETVDAFNALRKAGKIRAVALSNYTGARIAEWLDISHRKGCEPPAILQPHYNLVTRQPYGREIAPILADEGIAAVPYPALASGFLTGKHAGGSRTSARQPVRFSPAGTSLRPDLPLSTWSRILRSLVGWIWPRWRSPGRAAVQV